VYRVGVIGHSPEYYSDRDAVARAVDRTIDLIFYQYKEDLIINASGNIGVGHWAMASCLDRNIKYHIFLQCMPDIISLEWFSDQKESLNCYFKNAWSTTICEFNYKKELNEKHYEHLVDTSDFIICFWNGMKQGEVHSAIKYAFKKNKLVVDGMDQLKLITNERI